MHLAHRELLPPSGIEDACFADLAGLGSRNLVAARATGLDVFALRPALGSEGLETGKAKLELVSTLPLAERPTSVRRVVLQGNASLAVSGRRTCDVLAVSFEGGRTSILGLDPSSLRLVTLSLVSFEEHVTSASCVHVPSFAPTATPTAAQTMSQLAVDPGHRCTAQVVTSEAIGIIPLRRSALPPPAASGTSPDGAHALAGSSAEVASLASALHGRPRLLSLADVGPSGLAGSVRAVGFLSGYVRPTLAVLVESTPTSGPRLGHVAHSCLLAAVSMDDPEDAPAIPRRSFGGALRPGGAAGAARGPGGASAPGLGTDGAMTGAGDEAPGDDEDDDEDGEDGAAGGAGPRSSQLSWVAEALPHDSFAVVPVDGPIGGAVVLSSNAVLYASQGRAIGCAVNGFAAATVNTSAVRMTQAMGLRVPSLAAAMEARGLRPGEAASAAGAKPARGVRLDGCRWAWLRPDRLLLVPRDGQTMVASLVRSAGGSGVAALDVTLAGPSPTPVASLAAMGGRWLFVGSRTGDSVLLSYDIAEELGDAGAAAEPDADDADAGGATPGAKRARAGGAVPDDAVVALTRHARIRGSAPIASACLVHETTRLSEQAARPGMVLGFELLACAGEGRTGALLSITRGLRLRPTSSPLPLGGMVGAFSVSFGSGREGTDTDAAGSPFDSFLLLAHGAGTRVFAVGAKNLAELRGDAAPFVTGRSTIFAGGVAGGAAGVQVHERGGRVLTAGGTARVDLLLGEAEAREGAVCLAVDEEAAGRVEVEAASAAGGWVALRLSDGSVTLAEVWEAEAKDEKAGGADAKGQEAEDEEDEEDEDAVAAGGIKVAAGARIAARGDAITACCVYEDATGHLARAARRDAWRRRRAVEAAAAEADRSLLTAPGFPFALVPASAAQTPVSRPRPWMPRAGERPPASSRSAPGDGAGSVEPSAVASPGLPPPASGLMGAADVFDSLLADGPDGRAAGAGSHESASSASAGNAAAGGVDGSGEEASFLPGLEDDDADDDGGGLPGLDDDDDDDDEDGGGLPGLDDEDEDADAIVPDATSAEADAAEPGAAASSGEEESRKRPRPDEASEPADEEGSGRPADRADDVDEDGSGSPVEAEADEDEDGDDEEDEEAEAGGDFLVICRRSGRVQILSLPECNVVFDCPDAAALPDVMACDDDAMARRALGVPEQSLPLAADLPGDEGMHAADVLVAPVAGRPCLCLALASGALGVFQLASGPAPAGAGATAGPDGLALLDARRASALRWVRVDHAAVTGPPTDVAAAAAEQAALAATSATGTPAGSGADASSAAAAAGAAAAGPATPSESGGDPSTPALAVADATPTPAGDGAGTPGAAADASPRPFELDPQLSRFSRVPSLVAVPDAGGWGAGIAVLGAKPVWVIPRHGRPHVVPLVPPDAPGRAVAGKPQPGAAAASSARTPVAKAATAAAALLGLVSATPGAASLAPFPVASLCSFHSRTCHRGVVAILPHRGLLAIARLPAPDANTWVSGHAVISRQPLGATPRHVVYCRAVSEVQRVPKPPPPGSSVVVIPKPLIDPIVAVALEVRVPKDADEEAAEEAKRLADRGPETSQDEFGPHRNLAGRATEAPPPVHPMRPEDAPPLFEVRHVVRVYERRTGRVLCEIPLQRNERLLAMAELSARADSRARSNDSILVIGTTFVFPRGEDERPHARMLPIRVGRELGVEGIANAAVKLARLPVKEMHSRGVTAIAPLVTPHASFVVIGAGRQLRLMRWTFEGFEDAGFFSTRYWITSLSVAGSHIVIGDLTQSVRLVEWSNVTTEPTTLASDDRPLPVLATTMLSRGGRPGIVATTVDGDALVFHVSRAHGKRLVAGSGLRSSAPITSLVRIRLHPTDDATGSAEPLSAKARPRFGVLACDTDGGIGVLSMPDPAAHAAFHAAATVAAAALPSGAGIDPQRASAPRLARRPGGLIADMPSGDKPAHTVRLSGDFGTMVASGDRRVARDVVLAAGFEPAAAMATISALDSAAAVL